MIFAAPRCDNVIVIPSGIPPAQHLCFGVQGDPGTPFWLAFGGQIWSCWRLGQRLGPVGRVLGRLGRPLGGLGRPFGCLWQPLGRIGRPLGRLGLILGRLWDVLEWSVARFGSVSGCLGASWVIFAHLTSEKCDFLKTSVFLKENTIFRGSGRPSGVQNGVLKTPVRHLDRLWRFLGVAWGAWGGLGGLRMSSC